MSSTEIKAAAEEIADVPFQGLISDRIPIYTEIITRHLTPAGAEEAVDKAVDEIYTSRRLRKEGRFTGLDQIRADKASVLSAIQSVRPEIAETQAVMEELIEACEWARDLVKDARAFTLRGAARRKFDTVLAHAEEVLQPHEEAERKA